jgi:acetyl-CoA carboxylase carboxyltransferase component/biotin carboxyl carrier protein
MGRAERLAIVGVGPSAARAIDAAHELRAAGRIPIVTLAFHTAANRLTAPVQAADDAIEVAPDVPPLAAALEANGVTSLSDDERLGAACERLGIAFLAPDPRARSPEAVRESCRALELAWTGPLQRSDPPARLSVTVGSDGARCRYLGISLRTVCGGVEVAEAGSEVCDRPTAELLATAAVRLVEEMRTRGVSRVDFVRLDGHDVAVADVGSDTGPWATSLEVVSGLDLVRLQIELGLGGRLRHRWSAPRGHAVAVEVAFPPSHDEGERRTSIDLLRLPSGHGIRVDPGLRQDDVVPLEGDARPVVLVTCWGPTRADAMTRAQRALDQTVIVSSAETDRHAAGESLAAMAAPKAGSGPAGPAEAGSIRGEALALLAAAVEVSEAELARQRDGFYASAARGRPEADDAAGRTAELRYRGRPYRFDVFRWGRDEFEVGIGTLRIALRLERLGPFEQRLECGGEHHRVVTVAEGSVRRIDVDGEPHHVGVGRRPAVVAPAPALVVACRVRAGDRVRQGDPLVVLEAMKTEMTLTAPAEGTVAFVVDRGVQVGPGTTLVVVEPPEEEHVEGDPVDFHEAAKSAGTGRGPSCSLALEELGRIVLGYDADRRASSEIVARWSSLCAERSPADPEVVRAEESFLLLFADLASVTAPRPPAEGTPATREPFLTYLRALDWRHPALPHGFAEDLRRALAHYGIASLDRTPALEDAVFHLYRGQRRLPLQLPAVSAILDRRLAHVEQLMPLAGPEVRGVLDRLVSATETRDHSVADLARELRYRLFDQQVLERAGRAVDQEARRHLDALTSGGVGATGGRREHVDALVNSPQPMKRLLMATLAEDPRAERSPALEVLVRRYYRIRDLGPIRFVNTSGRGIAVTEYEHEGRRIRLHATFVEEGELGAAVADMGAVLSDAPLETDVLTDYFVWREAPAGEPDRIAADLVRVLNEVPFGRQIRRAVVSFASRTQGMGTATAEHFTFRPGDGGYVEDELYRGLHPMLGKRLDLWRLANFATQRLPSVEDVYLFRAVALENPKDERLFALAEVRDLTAVRNKAGRIVALPHLERMLTESLAAIRMFQSHRADAERLVWNRVLLQVWPPLTLEPDELFGIVHRLAPLAEGLGLEKVVVKAQVPDASGSLKERVLHISNPAGQGLTLHFDDPSSLPIKPLTPFRQKVVQSRQRGVIYPYELVGMLTPDRSDLSLWFPPGEFIEHDLDDAGDLVPVDRPWGENTANVVVGIVRNFTSAYPEGMTRVILLGDPTRALGSLAEPECQRIIAGLDLAERLGVPVEWFALSAGARISMDSGTENMDWIAGVLRRLIEFTQGGGEVNVVVCGINVGAQPYWNAEATMLMHTSGILVMTPDGAMVLTGKQALDFSGGVSADDNIGIGGYDHVMGPNGQAQYWATDLAEACQILLRHYDHTYVAPGERFPRRVPTIDPFDRDVGHSLHSGGGFSTVGEIFSETANPERKKPFDIRSVIGAVSDQDHPTLERWRDMRDGETVVVWDAHLGGFPLCLLGIESKPVARQGWIDADGPQEWTAGTLFPLSSKKAARAINAASGNRPLVVLANLSGFDGSPESLRRLQLEYGAEIGRAVVNFRGPMVFCVVSRYHGGAFVVFSKALNEELEVAAVEGAYASVIGGAPAAAVVFARDVETRVAEDKRVKELREEMGGAEAPDRARVGARLQELQRVVRAEKIGEVAEEFDSVHDIYRAQRTGSVDVIIPSSGLRPYLIDAVERGVNRWKP